MLESIKSLAPRRALEALGKLLRDPDDLPQVFTLIQALSGRSPVRILRRMRRSESGARLLRGQPDIVPLLCDREALRRLPTGSLGRVYLDFVESEGISPQGIVAANERGRAPMPEVPAELAWLRDRLRDTQDLWHAVTGYKGDVLGEVALLGFILAQTGNPGVALLVAAGMWKSRNEPEAPRLIAAGFRRGRRAKWLPAIEWEALLAKPIDEVRAQLGVGAPPVYTEVRSADLRARAAA
jgi:ubiquinone biosynthesis protein COQ4